jgi:hypothetical protein
MASALVHTPTRPSRRFAPFSSHHQHAGSMHAAHGPPPSSTIAQYDDVPFSE